jgi:hypothetical protein
MPNEPGLQPIATRVIDKQPCLVRLVTEECEIDGHIHIMINHRPSDVLNDSNEFIPVTDLRLTPRGTGMTEELTFIALRKDNILMLKPHPDNPEMKPRR